MLGIPFIIQREGERGIQRETVYLRSRRRGEAGEKMRKAIREHNAKNLEHSRMASKAVAAMRKVTGLDGEITTASETALRELEQTQGALFEAAQNARNAALAAAEIVAEEALRDNYGDRVTEILDGLTDAELDAIVSTVEIGAMPDDFFTSLDTRQKRNTTLLSGGQPAASSLPQDSAGQISNGAK